MALIGVGIYTPAEAAKLIGTESREVKRWLFGYAFRAHGASDRRNSPPLWTSQHAEDGQLVSFRDLLELRIVKAFVKHGVSLLVIRRVLENAQQMFGHSYPFTAMRFLTDGRTIFHEASKHSGDGGLTDLKSKQVVFTEVIRHSLYAGIEFDNRGVAKRWHPLHGSRAIVLDPEISFGKPIISGTGVPTATIADAVRAEKSFTRVAQLYDLKPAEVRSAVRFEEKLAA